MNKIEKNPLDLAGWINYIQNWKSQMISLQMPRIGGLIAIIIFLGSLIYLANIKDNIVNNLVNNQIEIATAYIILLITIISIANIAGFFCLIIARQLNNDMKLSSDFIERLLKGEKDTNKIRNDWLKSNEKRGEKKKVQKIPEIFNYSEKKKFTQTLLIVAGLLTAFNVNSTNIISLFMLFIVACLCLIIWISIIEKTDDKTKEEDYRRNLIIRAFLSSSVSFSFSGIVVLVGLRVISGTYVERIIGAITLITFYVILGWMLYIVLYKEKEKTC